MKFGVLGSLVVEDQGRVVPLSGARQRALLSIFLLHANEVVSADRLIDELWAEQPPGDGRTALAMQISRLRKSLHTNGDRVLLTRPNGYLLRVEAGALDRDRFEQLFERGRRSLAAGKAAAAATTLRRALALWRGSPFEDAAFASFAQIEIERLAEQRLAALEERIEADLALGRHEQLVAELEAFARQHPLRERLRGQLMLALYGSGWQADALAAYRDARRMLVEELGLEPGPALRELEQAILRHDPAIRPGQLKRRPAAVKQRSKVRHVRRRSWSCKLRPSPSRVEAEAHATWARRHS
jgi:DNA-binding SARP family transcriptional activator